MTSQTAINKAVKWALFSSAAIMVSAPAFAADDSTSTDSDQKVEKIEVTGSRIKRVDMETVSPVTVINAADIKMSGKTSVADVLQSVSANSFGNGVGVSGSSGGGSSQTTVDLRGLGATLVLLDGRRLPGTGNSGGQDQDISMIPLAVVDRIEILRDGASAIYGSDAIAGVVNIITKKHYDGVNLSYSVSSPKVNGGLEKKYQLTAGTSNEKGSIVMVAQHKDTNEVTDADVSGTNNGISTYSPVAYGTSTDGSDSYYNSDMCGQVANTIDTGSKCGYAYSNTTWLYPQYTKDSILTNATYYLTDDITFKGQVFAGKTTSWARYAATPVSTNTLTMDADNENNPLDEDMTIYLRALKNRDSKYEANNLQYVGSLEGTLNVWNGIDWNFGYQHSTESEVEHDYNLIKDSVIQDAIDDGTFDVFNTSGMSTDDWMSEYESVLDEAYHTGIYELDQSTDTFNGSLSSELYSDGDTVVNGYIGAEYEHLDFWKKSDPESANVEISGGSGGDDVDADRNRQSYFSEFVIDLPYKIEIDAAYRYDKYDLSGDVGGEYTNASFDGSSPKIGVMWRPTDNLLLRASWGKAFRAPSMNQLFASSSISFDYGLDQTYCASHDDADYCTEDEQFKTYYASNQDLQPETAKSYTAGFVWNITNNLSWEGTYWNFDYKNKIESLDVDTILAEEYTNGSSSRVDRSDDGKIESITTSYVNMATVKVSGIDSSVNYLIPTSIGDFKIDMDASYMLHWKEAADAGDDAYDYAGETNYPQLKGNLSVKWSQGDYSAAATFNYIGKQTDTLYDGYYNDIDAYVNTNVTASYNTSWNGKVSVGIANLFDQSPKYYTSDYWRGFDYDLYDARGRTLQFSYSQSF
ncbi:TonB-dependent receptor [Gallaecimonas mangrovi]|uniref:TonB-dependent receptor n=1 Tax=Gallaecimonas mangrovi TaxID=2291597 RepID=UPI0018676040|nr:TonB-dependent receptor [Gallaecimonas mangrovi]